MKKYLLLLAIFTLFILISCSGVTKKAEIEEKAKEAFASETLSRIQKNPASGIRMVPQVIRFKVTKIVRDRPADVAGGFYYVEGELTIQLKAAEDEIHGQKIWTKKGQIFLTEHAWFRCAAIENGYGNIIRITNLQLFKDKPIS